MLYVCYEYLQLPEYLQKYIWLPPDLELQRFKVRDSNYFTCV